MNQTTAYKVCVIGDGGVGKTAWVKKMLTGEFERKYVATLGVEAHTIRLEDHPNVCFSVWDCAGQEKLRGLKDGYYIQAKGAIVMFELGSRITWKNALKWMLEFSRMIENVPIVVIGNKGDIQPRKVSKEEVMGVLNQLTKPVEYMELSVRNDSLEDLRKPLYSLLNKLQ